MTVAILIILVVSVAVALAGSGRNLTIVAVTVVAGCFAVALAVGLMCNAFGIPRYEWQDPIILLSPLPVLATLAVWVGRDCDPITVSAMRRVFGGAVAHRRRLSAVRADVRRRVKQYSVEVA